MPDQVRETRILLREYMIEICVTYGFCLPPQKTDEILSLSILTATDFVRTVMDMEGLQPNEAKSHFGTLHGLLVKTLGAEEIPRH